MPIGSIDICDRLVQWNLRKKCRPPEDRPPPLPVVTTSGGHCSGRYASYCNAFFIITARKQSLQRLCFYTCLSLCSQIGGVWLVEEVSRPTPGGRLGVWTGGCPDPNPGGCIPVCTEADTPQSRRLLLRTVRILLECILVLIVFL